MGEHRVKATPEEVAEFVRKYGYRPTVHRVACDKCGKRLWNGGLGIGAHRRACKGAPKEA